MMELSDKVKCDASSFEVEWRASEPRWLPTTVRQMVRTTENIRRRLLRPLVEEASGSRERGQLDSRSACRPLRTAKTRQTF